MNLKQFIDKWNGKKADFDGAFGGQCVDLFRFYCKEVLEIPQPKSVIGAADFWNNYSSDLNLNENFEQIKNTPDFIPRAGDVMVWNKKAGGGFGHIGVVSDNNGTIDGFTSFDQNWFKISVCELVQHSYSSVYGVLRPKVQQGQFCLPTEEYKQLKIERDLYVQFKDNGYPSLQDVQRVLEQLRGERNAAREEASTSEKRAEEYRQKHQNFLERLGIIYACTADEISIEAEAKKHIQTEDQNKDLLKQLENVRNEHIKNVSELETKIGEVLRENERQKEVIERLTEEISKLKEGVVPSTQIPIDHVAVVEGFFTKIVKFLSKLFYRGKV